MRSIRILLFVFLSAALVLAFLYTGYVKTYLDEETQTTFFIKQLPTFRVQFHDPFANEADDVDVGKLPEKERRMFADYCKYRFGIANDDTESLERCKKRVPSYLK
ncbi:hypothetical protein EVC45_22570 [Paraburkholderia sp. UYCP14C]|uniref:hypothetical protein n=1 Tax=Paraburkholderia sp. UYCP14C TaxID=2511130 RepID=UPI00101F5522|nr:hypothetical protein [Paraburkholderia sp. UYCP14C]RZF27372.1 hypothetical protein EVC45_22570 [Paraburkholderia sp. UYCP14C]